MYILIFFFVCFFFFKQKTAYEMRISDWSSDVCSSDLPRLQPEAYANAARAVLAPGERISSIRFEPGEPVVVTAAQPAQPNAKGRPVRTMLWLDPADAKVLDQAPSSAGLVRVLHNLHGHLMIPGVGRQVVGWLGVAMLISCVSGIWLWWPTVGKIGRAHV